MKHWVVLLCIFLSFGCFAQKTTLKKVTLAPYLSHQSYEHFKRLVLQSPESSIEYIDGFTFEWGYHYELEIKEFELTEALSDGTQFLHTLHKLISKTKVPNNFTFQLVLDPHLYYPTESSREEEGNNTFKKIDANTYLYFDSVKIMVPESLKERFNKILEGASATLGTFKFVDTDCIKLLHL